MHDRLSIWVFFYLNAATNHFSFLFFYNVGENLIIYVAQTKCLF